METRDAFVQYVIAERGHGGANLNSAACRLLRNTVLHVTSDRDRFFELTRTLLHRLGRQRRNAHPQHVRALLETQWAKELLGVTSDAPLAGPTFNPLKRARSSNAERRLDATVLDETSAGALGDCEFCGEANNHSDHQRLNGMTTCIDCLERALAVVKEKRLRRRLDVRYTTETTTSTTNDQANEEATLSTYTIASTEPTQQRAEFIKQEPEAYAHATATATATATASIKVEKREY